MAKVEMVDYKYVEGPKADHVWTVFCKDEYSRRGEYSEEIDVVTFNMSPTAAKRVATAAIAQDYINGLRASRVVYRGQPMAGVMQLY